MKKIIKEKEKSNHIILILCGIIAIAIICISLVIFFATKKDQTTKNSATITTTTQQQKIEPTKAVILSTGDVILHTPFLKTGKQADGTYNYDYCFDNVKDEISKVDYAVCNCEVTLGGKEPYLGYPLFNAPDAIIDSLKKAGFDLLLCANNHSNDSGFAGMTRTVSVIRNKNLDQTGTFLTPEEKRYFIKDINGIRFGIINYTYETKSPEKGVVALNGVKISSEAARHINTFDYDHLDEFYADIQQQISNMKKDKAEALILYIHWGDEYKLAPNGYQKQMASKVANLGIDLIVGGHPHVIEPGEVIRTTDGRKVFCLYSTGNAVSNQRIEFMHPVSKTRHTEDGVFLLTEFEKDKDGKTTLSKVSYIPTYVRFSKENGNLYHRVVKATTDKDAALRDSYKRTSELLDKSINLFNEK
ncbi:MAG: CapA family protein [Clostridia bacterium]|nr:CapA family protein [Clostridia bacterium]